VSHSKGDCLSPAALTGPPQSPGLFPTSLRSTASQEIKPTGAISLSGYPGNPGCDDVCVTSHILRLGIVQDQHPTPTCSGSMARLGMVGNGSTGKEAVTVVQSRLGKPVCPHSTGLSTHGIPKVSPVTGCVIHMPF
jgi:hypothetical protein